MAASPTTSAGVTHRRLSPALSVPIALAALKRGHTCYLWLVRHRPYCGKRHMHGGGDFSSNPYLFLGHRVQHCTRRDLERAGLTSRDLRGYELVAIEEGAA